MVGQGHQLITIEIVGWCDLSRAHFQQNVDGNLIRCIKRKIADDFALLPKVFQPTEVANEYPLRIVFSNSVKKSYFGWLLDSRSRQKRLQSIFAPNSDGLLVFANVLKITINGS